jgi:F-type H+-transporting ATPase subunit alpha
MVKLEELAKVLRNEIDTWEALPVTENIGVVAQVGDSVARVRGLDRSVYGELIEFPSGAVGIVMNLEEDGVGIVLLSGESEVRDGDEARGTGRVVEVPVGPALIGRVVDPLGVPLDAKGPIEAVGRRSVESPAPGVIDRGTVDTPLQTGVLSIDAMIPIGRGQRELIIGDRQTGKTALAVDAIINQKGKGVVCVYCAIGQKASSVAAIMNMLEKHGAMEYTFVVLASASAPAALQYIAPYSACAMAEHFMHEGKDVLVVYDDLSKHAVAYRTISLLIRRPPGREAFPGDVFYLHSRLLERAARLSEKLGGGSITALPIVETQAGDISTYIPTNVISITDGQIFLDSELFFSGFRPAVDVGLSVSRVGGAAQTKAMRKVAGRLRLDLAQYRELAAFSQFGSDLDKMTQDKLAQGERLMEALKQAQYAPHSMEEEVVMLFLAVNGFLMETAVDKVRSTLDGFLDHLRYKVPTVLSAIASSGALSAETEAELRATAEGYMASKR